VAWKDGSTLKVKISRLTKSFGTHRALERVSLDVDSVRSLVLIGPSGGGKTTLLRILAGLEVPNEGEVELDGEKMRFDEGSLQRHRRTVSVVFQSLNLFPHLTAVQNITLPLEKVHGFSREEALDRARQLLSRFQLEGHAHKKPAALSGGQRQRVAIARAVATRPRILFFDEPTSALDPEMTAEVLDMIRQLLEFGCDLVLVTHAMGFARVIADCVAFLAEGRIVECGSAQSLFDAPQSEQCRRFLATVLKY
jgi:polar amino acid transport system ATP-binding protein